MANTNVGSFVDRAMEAGNGILRLTPTWVPRSFLTPGYRLKLDPRDVYALGADRGGVDERWFASTTPAANPGAPSDEGLSYIEFEGERVTLRDAVDARGPQVVGDAIWDEYERWPVYSKFFDNMGPIPHHMHMNEEQASLVGMEGKPEAYYFPPQLNATRNNFPYTFFGLEPGVSRDDIVKCLERWNEGYNGILNLSRAYRLQPGTGWLVPPCTLHAPGSLVTFEPQWGSDVFAMYQSMVEERPVPWDLLVVNVPEDKHQDLEYLADMLDYEENCDPRFMENHHLTPVPVADTADEGYMDRWVCYGKVNGESLFSARELTVAPGAKVTIKDNGPYGLIVTQGRGKIGNMPLECPAMIRYGQMTEDEVFVTAEAAREGVVVENTGENEPLVTLRFFGPETYPDTPEVGQCFN